MKWRRVEKNKLKEARQIHKLAVELNQTNLLGIRASSHRSPPFRFFIPFPVVSLSAFVLYYLEALPPVALPLTEFITLINYFNEDRKVHKLNLIKVKILRTGWLELFPPDVNQ